MSQSFDVVVIGAGASGALISVHLRTIAPQLHVGLLDAGMRAARGLAYGTPYGAHLLNVPAAKMSAFDSQPNHFAAWLQDKLPHATDSTYAPRTLYGEYLANILEEALAPPSRVERIWGTVVGLTREADAWKLHLHDGRTLLAQAVVLALGNLPPTDPLSLGENVPQNYLRDPWAPGAAQGLDPQAPLLIIGTGLTAIDLALALRDEGHQGIIHAISRRGLLSRSHAPYRPRPLSPPPYGTSPSGMMRWLRQELATAQTEGDDWRAVIDAIRPYTQKIWQSWTLCQRDTFLRHARVLWDIHRHRCAPEVGQCIDKLINTKQFIIHRGRIRALYETPQGIRVFWQPPTGEVEELTVARVINCTGPATNDEYAKLLNSRTKLVALGHVSNVLGTVVPVELMTAMAHWQGIPVLIDGAQSVPHFQVNVQALGADFYVFSGHKLFAPTGIGVLYGKAALLEAMPPWQGGGNMINHVTFDKTSYNDIPYKFEAGTGNIADAVGLGAAIDYLQHIGFEAAAGYEHGLLHYGLEQLATIPGLRLIGTAPHKVSVLSFIIEGIPYEQVGQYLAHQGIAVRAGHHCAQPTMQRYGLTGTVRPSLAFYNTYQEIDILVAALKQCRKAV